MKLHTDQDAQYMTSHTFFHSQSLSLELDCSVVLHAGLVATQVE